MRGHGGAPGATWGGAGEGYRGRVLRGVCGEAAVRGFGPVLCEGARGCEGSPAGQRGSAVGADGVRGRLLCVGAGLCGAVSV